MGIKEFAIDSNGNLYSSISKTLFNKEKQLKKLQKHHARKKNPSNRKEKCRIKIARKYEQIVNIRDYFHWHLVNKLCSENQTVVVENLAVANMIKNRKLSHSISYLGWSSFVNKLKQKAVEYKTKIVEAPRFFASSKTCYCCGEKKDKLSLSERTYHCDKCGVEIDRDINAALNLKSLEFSDNSRGEIIRPKKLYFDFAGNFCEAITKKIA